MSAVSASPVLTSQKTPDFSAIKQRQQATWASGDFSVVAARIVYQAEQLCETADLQAGWRVLDVATGSGNAALAAARRVGAKRLASTMFPPCWSVGGFGRRRSTSPLNFSKEMQRSFRFQRPRSTRSCRFME